MKPKSQKDWWDLEFEAGNLFTAGPIDEDRLFAGRSPQVAASTFPYQARPATTIKLAHPNGRGFRNARQRFVRHRISFLAVTPLHL
jgi:hypothetical protein